MQRRAFKVVARILLSPDFQKCSYHLGGTRTNQMKHATPMFNQLKLNQFTLTFIKETVDLTCPEYVLPMSCARTE